MKVEYTRIFTRDLQETLAWIAERSPSRAETFAREIELICEDMIASRPTIGSWRPRLGDDVRGFHAASVNRTVYYRVDSRSKPLYFMRLVYRQNVKPEDFRP